MERRIHYHLEHRLLLNLQPSIQVPLITLRLAVSHLMIGLKRKPRNQLLLYHSITRISSGKRYTTRRLPLVWAPSRPRRVGRIRIQSSVQCKDGRFAWFILGPFAGLEAQKALFDAAIAALGDPAQSLLVLVARPQSPALDAVAQASAELAELGLTNQHLVVDGVSHAAGDNDPLGTAMDQQVQSSLANLPQELIDLPRTDLPLSVSRSSRDQGNTRPLERQESGVACGSVRPARFDARRSWLWTGSSTTLGWRPRSNYDDGQRQHRKNDRRHPGSPIACTSGP